MKIVHIHQYYNDKMGYHENILPRYQAKLGHEVFLITSNLSNGFNEDRIKEIGEYKDINFTVKRIGIMGEFKERFVIFKELYKYLEELKPNYIYHHAVCTPSLKTVCNYKRNHENVFLVADNHLDLNIAARYKLWRLVYYNIFWANFIKRYDKYIDLYFGVTPIRCLFLKEQLRIKDDKIRLLPIGAEIDNINISSSKEEVFKWYGLDKNKFTLIHGGKMTRNKQTDRLLEAFKQVNNDDVQFILFGSIQDEKIEKMIKSDKRIKYIGWLNRQETLSILRYSDIGIWNTQHTTLLEDSIAVGLPLILRYYGSTSHLIDNSGLFLYEGSIDEIYINLNLIINNQIILNKLKKNTIKMSKILSYNNIAKESLEYMTCQRPKEIHNKFMKKEIFT